MMAKPYSMDLRERVLKDCDAGMCSTSGISNRLQYKRGTSFLEILLPSDVQVEHTVSLVDD